MNMLFSLRLSSFNMKLFTPLFVIILIGCTTSKHNNLRYFQDYENAKGWTGALIDSGIAYSGKFSQKVINENEYGEGLRIPLGEADKQPLKKIKANVKIAATQLDGEIFLVIDIFSPSENKSIAYNSGANQSEIIKSSKAWAVCTNEMFIPANAKANDIVKVYVWNPRHQQFFMDDFEVTFEK
ncbi:MAG: hypothetical protein HYX40_05325 [Sphingobacteriales bacterium]|nr:hypothetical protein [Sphingobacteriales bacterium]